MMNLEEIKNILPHRYPFLLVDRVLEVRDGEYCKALKMFPETKKFFWGISPNRQCCPV